MKKHPLSPIPPHGGIYAVTNETTGHVYIGRSINLARRFSEWRHAFIYKRAMKNGPIADLLAQDDNLYHWTFAILYDNPDATQEQLAQQELLAIQKTKAKVGKKLLNSIMNHEPINETMGHIQLKTQSLTVILDENGDQISQSKAAAILGCRTDTLQQRLAYHRKKRGITKITLEELMKK